MLYSEEHYFSFYFWPLYCLSFPINALWLHLWYLQNCSDDRKFWSDSKVIISIKASFPTIFYVQNVDNSRQSLVFCELSEIHSCIYQEVFEETKVVIGIRKSKRDRQHNGQMKKEKEQTTIYKTLHRKRKNVISAFYWICRHLNLKSIVWCFQFTRL